MIMKKVTGIRQYENERSFSVSLEGDLALLFKMHGNRANVVLFENNKATEIFRNHLKADWEIDLHQTDKNIDFNREYFTTHQDQLKKTYFTFGNHVWDHVAGQGFENATVEQRGGIFSATLKHLEGPKFFMYRKWES